MSEVKYVIRESNKFRKWWGITKEFALANFWLLLAFCGLLLPRFVSLTRFLGDLQVNNFVDLLIGTTDVGLFIILLYEFFRRDSWFHIWFTGLLVLGFIQLNIGYMSPNLSQLVDYWLFTFRLLLWVVVFYQISTFISEQKIILLALLVLLFWYSLLEHLLLSMSLPVLLVWFIVEFYCQYLSEKNECKTRFDHFRVWLWFLVIFFGLNAFLAFWQVSVGASLGLYLLGEPVLNADRVLVARQAIGNYQIVLMRGYGLMQHPNLLGFVGVLGVWFVWVLQNWSWQIKIILGLSGLLVLLSFSRIAWIGLIFIIIAWVISKNHEASKNASLHNLIKVGLEYMKKFWWLAIGLMVVFIYIFYTRFATEYGTDRVRLGEYSNYFGVYEQLNLQYIFLGIGLGQYPFYLRIYDPSLFWWEWQPIHNLWFNLFVELGLVASLILLSVMWLWFRKMVFRSSGYFLDFDQNELSAQRKNFDKNLNI